MNKKGVLLLFLLPSSVRSGSGDDVFCSRMGKGTTWWIRSNRSRNNDCNNNNILRRNSLFKALPKFRRREQQQQQQQQQQHFSGSSESDLSKLLAVSTSVTNHSGRSIEDNDHQWHDDDYYDEGSHQHHNYFDWHNERIVYPRPSRKHEQQLLHITRILPRWIKLPRLLKEIDIIQLLAVCAKFAAMGVVAFGIVSILRDVIREARDDVPGGDGDEDFTRLFGGYWTSNNNSPSGSNAAFSPSAAKKIISWLQEPKEMRGDPPSNFCSAWMISLAEELRDCTAVSLAEIYRILLQLSKPEAALLHSCLLPSANKVSFETVGGLPGVQEKVRRWISSSSAAAAATAETVSPHLTSELSPDSPHSKGGEMYPYYKLLQKVNGRQGMVLYGPPGCGKSLLMRAIAEHSGLPTLVVTPSLIQRKWYGESTQRIRSLFGLIKTLKSCVVVIDEIDGIFRSRREEDHEVTRELKTEWLQWWDSAVSSSSSTSATSDQGSSFSTGQEHRQVLIVAATNRPWDVDPAAWRRLPNRIYVGMPTTADRYDLLRKWTQDLPHVDPLVLQYFVEVTEGYSPSDLYHVLVWACQLGPIARHDTNLTVEDICAALAEVSPTRFSVQYIHQMQSFLSSHGQDSTPSSKPTSYSSLWSKSYPAQETNLFPQAFSTSLPQVGGLCWETPMGNFYQIQVPVDSQVLDAIRELFWTNFDWDLGDWSDCDDSDFDDDDDDDEL